jgi:hypothetical protein
MLYRRAGSPIEVQDDSEKEEIDKQAHVGNAGNHA